QDLLAIAEADDVPDDEEVAGQVELLDGGQLFFDLRLRARGERAEAGGGAVPGDLAEIRHRRLAGRQRIIGKLISEVGQREIERLRQLPGVVDRLRQIGEE